VEYCTPTYDANPNQIWKYNSVTGGEYQYTGKTCCSATGIAGTCAVPVHWTEYCTPSYDQNLNQVWEYNDATPAAYRFTGKSCCSATGAAGACVVPPANWVEYCTQTNDPNPNRIQKYNSVTDPYGMSPVDTGKVCCSATGVSGTCGVVTPPPVETGHYCPYDGQSYATWEEYNAFCYYRLCQNGLDPGSYPGCACPAGQYMYTSGASVNSSRGCAAPKNPTISATMPSGRLNALSCGT
jgi:hypothetical protein